MKHEKGLKSYMHLKKKINKYKFFDKNKKVKYSI